MQHEYPITDGGPGFGDWFYLTWSPLPSVPVAKVHHNSDRSTISARQNKLMCSQTSVPALALNTKSWSDPEC